MKNAIIQTQIEERIRAILETYITTESFRNGAADWKGLNESLSSLFDTVWEEAEKVGGAKGMEDANEDWYSHLERGFALEDIYKAIKENIKNFKQTT